MYYHSQEVKYVTCGKIYPAPAEAIDEYMLQAYKWLGKYCGYCPQIWLGRGRSSITGYKSKNKQKGSRYMGSRRNFEPNVMFGFDIVVGFPVDFDTWCSCLNPLINCKDGAKEGNDAIKRSFDGWIEDFKKDPDPIYSGDVEKLPKEDILYKWAHSKNFDDFLNKCLFVEHDQVVVPSLNLKVAKEICCRNEKQVKALRHMGFIQDRIKILNSKQWD
jgi:hypothetical protein